MRLRPAVFIIGAIATLILAVVAALFTYNSEAERTGSIGSGPLMLLPDTTVVAVAFDTSLTLNQQLALVTNAGSLSELTIGELVGAPAADEVTGQPWADPGIAAGYVNSPSGEGWIARVAVNDAEAAQMWVDQVNQSDTGWGSVDDTVLTIASAPTAVALGATLATQSSFVADWIPDDAVAAAYVNASLLSDTSWNVTSADSASFTILSVLDTLGATSSLSEGRMAVGASIEGGQLVLSGAGQGVRFDGAPLPVPGDVSDAARTPQGSTLVVSAANVGPAWELGSVPLNLATVWARIGLAGRLSLPDTGSVLGQQFTLAAGVTGELDAEPTQSFAVRSEVVNTAQAVNAAKVLALSNAVPGGAWSVDATDGSVVAATDPQWFAFMQTDTVRPDVAQFPGLDSPVPASVRIAVDASTLRVVNESVLWNAFNTLVVDFAAQDNDQVSISGTLTLTAAESD